MAAGKVAMIGDNTSRIDGTNAFGRARKNKSVVTIMLDET